MFPGFSRRWRSGLVRELSENGVEWPQFSFAEGMRCAPPMLHPERVHLRSESEASARRGFPGPRSRSLFLRGRANQGANEYWLPDSLIRKAGSSEDWRLLRHGVVARNPDLRPPRTLFPQHGGEAREETRCYLDEGVGNESDRAGVCIPALGSVSVRGGWE